MPHPDRLLPILRRAAEAFHATPGRRGHVVQLIDADDVCVCGDLHGNVENFGRLLKVADLSNKPRRHLVVQELVHGKFHYPDGGDKSHQMLDLLAALKCQFPERVHFLPGNHELAQWTNRRIGKGTEDLNDVFRLGVQSAYKDYSEEIYVAYMQIIAASSSVVHTENRVFLSHSLPSAQHLASFDPAILERDEFAEPELALGGTVHSLVWGRNTSEEHVTAFLRKVDADWLITGHIPQEAGFAIPNTRQIIVDAQASPACYCLFPCDRPLSMDELKVMVGFLN